MSNLVDFFRDNFTTLYGPFPAAICLGIVWMVCYDFYHLFFSGVLSWFKK